MLVFSCGARRDGSLAWTAKFSYLKCGSYRLDPSACQAVIRGFPKREIPQRGRDKGGIAKGITVRVDVLKINIFY